MKKIINAIPDIVTEMLDGVAAAHPETLRRLEGQSVIVRKEIRSDKVTLVSGGGSGHEPAHAGYVGTGMLDAAVAGEVFTSPTPDRIKAAIDAVRSDAGTLLIVKNYSGDVMNFEMAAELAETDGVKTRSVIVNDDVAVENSTYTTGRRGIAGTVFVHKIAGALAERGANLDAVAAVAQKVVGNVRSMGFALSPCTVPANGRPGFDLGDGEMEFGLGIHGEPGVRRAPVENADSLAKNLLAVIFDDLPFRRGDRVAVLVNGLGGTPLMELYILNRSVAALCRERGLAVAKTYVGNFMTSLEMTGASVSLLRLDPELESLLADPSDAPAFRQ
jgi:dihydroxyacetone kinase-like protein